MRLPTYPFKMAAIMADEEEGVKMDEDDQLIKLKESLSFIEELLLLESFYVSKKAVVPQK